MKYIFNFFLTLYLSLIYSYSQVNDPLITFDSLSQKEWVESTYNKLKLDEKTELMVKKKSVPSDIKMRNICFIKK